MFQDNVKETLQQTSHPSSSFTSRPRMENIGLFTNYGYSDLHDVDAFYGPTHDRARSRDARRSSLQHLLREPVRPVRGTGQTGRRAERR